MSLIIPRCVVCDVIEGHRPGCPRNPDETTHELDTRELPAYDDDNEDTLPDAGAETSHQ